MPDEVLEVSTIFFLFVLDIVNLFLVLFPKSDEVIVLYLPTPGTLLSNNFNFGSFAK